MSTQITWYGHATLGVNTSGYQLIIDPFFSGNPASSIKADEVQADYLLITHGHGDHVGDSVAIAQRTNAEVISNAEIVKWISQQGVKKTHCSASRRWIPISFWISQTDTGIARICASRRI